MRKLMAFVLGGLLSATALAEDLLQCVDPHVLNAILVPVASVGEFRVSTDPIEQLEGVETPAGLEWIGSRVSSEETLAAYRSALDPFATRERLTAALQQAGFQTRDSTATFGFDLEGPPLLTVVCRGTDQGTVIVRERADDSIAAVNFRAATQRSCEEAMQPPERPASFLRALAWMPYLGVPAEVRESTRPGTLGSGGGGGGGDAFSSAIEVENVGSPLALLSALDAQLLEQGWTRDSGWSTARSSGSLWLRDVDDGPLAGRLSITHLVDGYYELEFVLFSG